MKTGFSRRVDSQIEENDKDNPNCNLTGDVFYDYVGKFCNSDAKLILEASLQGLKSSILTDEGENVLD